MKLGLEKTEWYDSPKHDYIILDINLDGLCPGQNSRVFTNISSTFLSTAGIDRQEINTHHLLLYVKGKPITLDNTYDLKINYARAHSQQKHSHEQT